MSFDDLFTEATREKTKLELMIEEKEAEFTGKKVAHDTPETLSREQEKESLEKEKIELNKKLRKFKNGRNVLRTDQNDHTVVISKKKNDTTLAVPSNKEKIHSNPVDLRNHIRLRLSQINARLQQITDEEIGSKADAVGMINAAKQAQIKDITKNSKNGKMSWDDVMDVI
jgi:hypothetical protein